MVIFLVPLLLVLVLLLLLVVSEITLVITATSLSPLVSDPTDDHKLVLSSDSCRYCIVCLEKISYLAASR